MAVETPGLKGTWRLRPDAHGRVRVPQEALGEGVASKDPNIL